MIGTFGISTIASAPNNEQMGELMFIGDNSLLTLTQVIGKSGLLTEIETTAQKYGISEQKSIQVAKCESTFNQGAIGKAGEIGLYQFKQKTWNWFNGLRETNLNINNWRDQIDMYCWAIAHGYSSHWTCYNK
jgi:soluble lytic murein transglycosylase-like protein